LRRLVALVVIALMSALAFIATSLIIVPLPWTGGYFNLGDAAVILSGLLFGSAMGGAVGAIGPTVADIIAGYYVFAPATLVAKALEGAVSGLVVGRLAKMDSKTARRVSLMITGLYGLTGIGILVYLMLASQTSETLLMSGTWAVVFIAFSLVILMTTLRGRWSDTTAAILAGAVGATLMVGTYFVYEQFLMGVPAILEVVPNCLQGMLGSGIAGMVYGYKGLRDRIDSVNR